MVWEHLCDMLTLHCRRLGIAVDPVSWRRSSWLHRLHRASTEVLSAVPPGEKFILIDDAQFGSDLFADRHGLPFVEKDGGYWGPPPDDEAGICELERLVHSGASYLAVAWQSFWWLEQYPGLFEHVRSRYPCVAKSDDAIIFDLRS